MTYLQRGPTNIEQSWKNCIIGILRGIPMWLIVLIYGDIAAEYEYQSEDIPWSSLSPSCIVLIWQITNNWSGYAITQLSCQHRISSYFSLHYSLQIIKEKVKPTCSHQIIQEVSNSISQYFYLIQIIKSVLFMNQMGWFFQGVISYYWTVCHT